MSYVVERLSGTGTLSDNGKDLGEVDYDLVVYQETNEITTLGGRVHSVEGHRQITGSISPLAKQDFFDLWQRGARLVLTLDDGRIWECLLGEPGGKLSSRGRKGIHTP